jgi:hypothetical protein
MEYDYRLFTFVIALITYTLTVPDEFWDCGEYIATAAKLKLVPKLSAFISNDLVPFLPCLLQITNILLMVNMTCCFERLYYTIPFWSSSMILKKVNLQELHQIKKRGQSS